ncbi:SDR family oxidoreductase [Paenibacillus peoriae]|uniref:SDR family oxidoreductase n=1 Tax=Paenibacillus peoriae TaxID=59893 RepID=UPI00215AB454|nr:SDR family oxidoreductase [Paenibacillus peoriae]
MKPEQNDRSSTLRGQRIILFGGTSGVGFATAEAAAREGASVVVVSSRKEKVHNAILRLPQGSEGHVVDLSSEEQVRTFFSQIGELDHLVFSAGDSLLIKNLSSIDVETAQRSFNLRYWGAFMAAKYGSENIRQNGSIILTSGIAGVQPQKGLTVAASVCSAVESLARALAVELSPLRVNTVSLGLIRTEMWDNIPEEDLNAMYETAGKDLPAGRAGEPEDAAEAYLYLMRGKYSTGHTIVLDGGSTLV